MHYDIKEIGPKGTPPTHNYLPRNKAFIVHFASSLFSLSSAAAMERQCLAMMCALCVAALCCRSGAQPGIVEETVCTNNSSAVQGVNNKVFCCCTVRMYTCMCWFVAIRGLLVLEFSISTLADFRV